MDGLAETSSRPGYRPTVGLVLTGGGSRSAYQGGGRGPHAPLLPRGPQNNNVVLGTTPPAIPSR